MATLIIELLGEHTSYVEPFGGSAAVLLQKPETPIEVYNDLNLDVVTFFRVLRDSPLKLLEQIEATPFSRVEYLKSCMPATSDGVSDIEQARLFFIRSWQGFSGSATQKRNGWRYQQRIYRNRMPKCHLDWDNLDRLEAAAVRMRRVQIECEDALQVIKRFAGPSTVFYVDPPYPSTTRSKQWGRDAYTFEMRDSDHTLLLNLLRKVEGHVILSCYDSALYKHHLQGWKMKEVKTVNNRGTPASEYLWIKPHGCP